MFFHLKNNYQIKESHLSDNNRDLILIYKVIKNSCNELITELSEIEEYHLQKSEEKRKENFYKIRDIYNRQDTNYQKPSSKWIKRAGYFIFLNKTCFNGLYRLNTKGEFNVPFGRYKNPRICDEQNLKQVKRSLEYTNLFSGDFNKSSEYIDDNTFVYLDPPYRPLNNTSYFTKYSKEGFNDDSQKKLADFFKKMDIRGAKLMLSNSDPQNHNEHDNFFDELYDGFKVERVTAKRNINRDPSKRGVIKELIVRNYS